MATAHARNPWVSGLLSGLLPGLGQFYNRQWVKGGGFLVGFVVVDGALGVSAGFLKFLQAASSGEPPENMGQLLIFSLFPLAIAIWSVADAALTAKKS